MKIISFLMIAASAVLLTSCSTDHQAQFLGVWEADQASQKVGSDEQLTHYNYVNVTAASIHLRNFNYEMKKGEAVQVFDDSDKSIAYAWKSNDHISIDDKLYQIELKKKEMIIKNDNIEIHYNKKK